MKRVERETEERDNGERTLDTNTDTDNNDDDDDDNDDTGFVCGRLSRFKYNFIEELMNTSLDLFIPGRLRIPRETSIRYLLASTSEECIHSLSNLGTRHRFERILSKCFLRLNLYILGI